MDEDDQDDVMIDVVADVDADVVHVTADDDMPEPNVLQSWGKEISFHDDGTTDPTRIALIPKAINNDTKVSSRLECKSILAIATS